MTTCGDHLTKCDDDIVKYSEKRFLPEPSSNKRKTLSMTMLKIKLKHSLTRTFFISMYFV